jgi:serine/arginine repetitive matrix protein 2
MLRASDDSGSPQTYPIRLSVNSRIQSDRSPLNTDVELDEVRTVAAEPSLKRVDSTSTWEKVKSTFSRSGSTGRRSRTNSIVKRDNTDSSMSRESGASLGSGKTDKADLFAIQQIQQPLQQSASASVLSLSPHPAPRSSTSPIPPASTADLMKYKDSKLFPFPGMKKLEEQRNRARGMSLSSSTPDILLATNGDDIGHYSSSSGTPAQTPDKGRERKLSHQASDSHLMGKYKNLNAPQISTNPSTSSHIDYFTLAPHSPPQMAGSASLKLPTNREGVRRWLSAKKLFPSQTAASPSPSSSSASPPVVDIRPSNTNKKPSLTDVLRGGKDDLTTEWEDMGSDKSHTPTTTASASMLQGKQTTTVVVQERDPPTTVNGNGLVQSDTEKTPRAHKALPHFDATPPHLYTTNLTPDLPSPPDFQSSTTPDPLSSLSDYPARSTSGSSSNTSSEYSQYRSYPNVNPPSQGAIVLERLDDLLGRGSRSPMWASAIDDPPRKLLLSSPVLQVVNSNTVKDRFLFLFSDMLVIAKPIVLDQDALMDTSKPNPMDRKFIVKSVVLLRHLRFQADREEARKSSNSFVGSPRHPVIRTFVLQFAKDPDHAISTLFEKAGRRDDPVALGQLLFKSLELDRAQLGDYLSRRTSKMVLKAYVDSFGFTGLRVDKALRIFLHSISIPERTPHTYAYSPLDALLDSFAGRWYEANAGIVAYDKDLAFRLVRAVVQLNEVLHGGIAQEPCTTAYPKRNITCRDFLEAFRRYDGRGLATDELLSNIYDSIRRERLSQARNPLLGGPPDIAVTVKRPPPTRLTYRVQSEPIVLRIPQPDPQLNIHLYGQGLIFDPPVLAFAKSSEASFRITGTSLGSKTMIMSRSGPNALLYTGLPQSCSVVVERAFMRNTFNLAFTNHEGVKRRYMFSVDDPLIRHQWTVSLKREIDASISSTTASSASLGTLKFHRAAERTAFKVLQETLIGPAGSSGPPPSSIDKALDRLTMSPRTPYTPVDAHSVFAKEQRRGAQMTARNGTRDSHVRSKSRSQVYHKQGAGRLELDLSQSSYGSLNSFNAEDRGRGVSTIEYEQESRAEGRLWSGRDLEMHCQQNSSIALVLACVYPPLSSSRC